MKILILNSGSSSLKYELFEMPQKKSLQKWNIEKIWIKWWTKNHKEAIKQVTSKIKNIDAIWHRIVHWWEKFSDSVIINNKILQEIKDCGDLAPLHNPANIEGILACQEIIPDVPQVWVFDTAFHQTIPQENYIYAIPYKYYKKYWIRKYWFHGTSHKYVSHRACEILKKDINSQKIITCHIGNGVSITAIKDWSVVNTSMWFTPLAWLVMWTRSWDIDPAIIDFLSQKEGLTTQEINNILNKKSWLLWISWQSSDLRDIETGDSQCQLALNVYINRIIEYIGSYIALMWWVDMIILTAWVGEKSPIVRQKIVEKLWYLWIYLDEAQNNKKSEEVIISTKDSKIKILVIPTQEELMIAQDTYTLVNAIK